MGFWLGYLCILRGASRSPCVPRGALRFFDIYISTYQKKILLPCFSHYIETCIGGRRFKDKKEVVEPEADPERDQRTVFAYQVLFLLDIYVFEMQVSINVINVFCLFSLLL